MSRWAELSPEVPPEGIDCLIIGSAVMALEHEARTRAIDTLVVPVARVSGDAERLSRVGQLVQELVEFVLARRVRVRFRRRTAQRSLFVAKSRAPVYLFSGGVDSTAGILLGTDTEAVVPQAVFCSHTDQSKSIELVRSLAATVLMPRGVVLHEIPVPPLGSGGYVQTRGFVYLQAAAAVAGALGSRRVVVTECGPTMFQPSLSPLDSTTLTTHPVVVQCGLEVARVMLGRELSVERPFRRLTKAEVMRSSPEPEIFPLTHSCISQRFGTHDGTCYGCVIRRLAAIAADVPDVNYVKDVLRDEAANSGNLLAHLAFCRDVLRGIARMPTFQREPIREYHTGTLFRRFALDSFGAIHALVRKGEVVTSTVQRLYEAARKSCGAGRLEARLAELRRM